MLQHRLTDIVAEEFSAAARMARRKSGAIGAKDQALSSDGVSARVRAARLRGLSLRMA